MRNRLQRHYTVVPTELIFDKNVSDKAKMLYAHLASKPDCYSFKYLELMDELEVKNRATLWRYFKELLENGWVSRHKVQDAKGLFRNGFEFALHDIQYKFKDEGLTRKNFFDIEDDDLRYTNIEYPEMDLGDGYKVELEVSSLPINKTAHWFLMENSKEPHSYTLEALMLGRILIEERYLIKRYKIGTKFTDYMFLGTDVKHVNLTVNDMITIRKTFKDDNKIYRMIKTLDEWLDDPENINHLKIIEGKSCRDYFKIRAWLEEKVRRDIINERKKHV